LEEAKGLSDTTQHDDDEGDDNDYDAYDNNDNDVHVTHG
jgi:hypothetical protein